MRRLVQLPAALVLLAGAGSAGGSPAASAATHHRPDAAPAVKAVHFVQTATKANVVGDASYVHDAAIDGKPRAVLFVTSSWNPRDTLGGIYDDAPVGVRYLPARRLWAVFNENQTQMPVGASFDVLAFPTPTATAFVARATRSSSGGQSTLIQDPLTEGRASLQLQVTPVWNPGGKGGVYDAHPIGVWWDAGARGWAILNEDEAAMPIGAAFDVLATSSGTGAKTTALQTASVTNLSQNVTRIDNVDTNGDPRAVLFVTPTFNPGGKGGTYDGYPVGVFYDLSESPNEWGVFNESSGDPMPIDASFDVLIFTR